MSDFTGSEIKQIALSAGIATASGANTYTASILEVKSLFFLLRVTLKITTANTGAATLNLNGFGAVNIFKGVTTALVSGDLPAGSTQQFSYDGTNWQVSPTVILPTTANAVLSNNAAGQAQAIYTVTDILGSTTEATLLAQDWTSGSVTANGTPPQMVFGSTYIFICSGTNTWKRTPVGVTSVDLYLASINDTTVQTSTQMAAAYPAAVQGNRVRGNTGVYEYFGLVGWWYFAKTS